MRLPWRSLYLQPHNSCCASGYQLVGDELLDISSVYVYERAVKSFKLLNQSQFATRSIILL